MNRIVTGGLLTTVVLLTLAQPGLASTESDLAAESLRTYYESLQFGKVELIAELYVAELNDEQVLREREKVEIALDHARKRIRVNRAQLSIPGSSSTRLNGGEQLIGNGSYFMLGNTNASDVAEAVTSKMETSEKDWEVYVNNSFFGVLFGMLPLDQPANDLAYLLQELKPAVSKSGDGLEGDVELEGKVNGASVRVVLDAKNQYMPRRVKVDLDSPNYRGLVQYDYRVTSSQVIEGVAFPKTASITTTRSSGGEKKETRRTNRELTIVKSSFQNNLTDADFQLSMTVPNETTVVMEDAPHLSHVWRDGKAVPDFGSAVAIPGAPLPQEFSPREPSNTRLVFLIITVCVICALMAALIRNRTKSRT